MDDPWARAAATLDTAALAAGWCTVALREPLVPSAGWAAIDAYFAQPAARLAAATQAAGLEAGYRSLPGGRQLFMARSPAELPPPLAPLSECRRRCDALGRAVLARVAGELAVPPACLLALLDPEAPGCGRSSVLRALRYPAGEGVACGAHEDLGVLTIAPTSPVPGLQALDLDEMAWHDVERPTATPRAVVMVGASLAALSHGRLAACVHRVVARPRARLSLVYQVRLRADAELGALLPQPSAARTGAELLAALRDGLQSVNGTSYADA